MSCFQQRKLEKSKYHQANSFTDQLEKVRKMKMFKDFSREDLALYFKEF